MLNNMVCTSTGIEGAIYDCDTLVLFLCKKCVAAMPKLDLPELAAQAVKAYTDKFTDIYEVGTVSSFSYLEEGQLKQVLIAGCGSGSDCKPVNFKKAAGNVARQLKQLQAVKVVAAAPIVLKDTRAHYLQAIAEGLYLGAYTFDKYKSKAGDKAPSASENPQSVAGERSKAEASKAVEASKTIAVELINGIPGGSAVLEQARIIAEAVCLSRDLVNEPGNVLYPETMAEAANKVAHQLGLEIEVLDEAKMEELGMGALLAVGKGSARGSRLITLKYNGNGDAPYVAYVGKGITFDSGGVSIKPDDNMGEMKDDMTGAACVLGAIKAVAELGLKVNLLAILCCAENMPDGLAQRPGDIVRAANGKTIEVVSTDAEGRMVLADGVWYACRKGAKKVIDIATLTGAVIVALGNETSGIIANEDGLAEEIKRAGKLVGESWWQLPSLPECKEAIKSDVADVLNSAGRAGGTITGGLFINEFVDEGIAHAHLDIGGTSTATKTEGFKVKGGTAFGTMTLIKLAEMM